MARCFNGPAGRGNVICGCIYRRTAYGIDCLTIACPLSGVAARRRRRFCAPAGCGSCGVAVWPAVTADGRAGRIGRGHAGRRELHTDGSDAAPVLWPRSVMVLPLNDIQLPFRWNRVSASFWNAAHPPAGGAIERLHGRAAARIWSMAGSSADLGLDIGRAGSRGLALWTLSAGSAWRGRRTAHCGAAGRAACGSTVGLGVIIEARGGSLVSVRRSAPTGRPSVNSPGSN
jgi:hypothetical protein